MRESGFFKASFVIHKSPRESEWKSAEIRDGEPIRGIRVL